MSHICLVRRKRRNERSRARRDTTRTCTYGRSNNKARSSNAHEIRPRENFPKTRYDCTRLIGRVGAGALRESFGDSARQIAHT